MRKKGLKLLIDTSSIFVFELQCTLHRCGGMQTDSQTDKHGQSGQLDQIQRSKKCLAGPFKVLTIPAWNRLRSMILALFLEIFACDSGSAPQLHVAFLKTNFFAETASLLASRRCH